MIPEQLCLSASNTYPSEHSQKYDPSVLLHVSLHPPLLVEHSSISKIMKYFYHRINDSFYCNLMTSNKCKIIHPAFLQTSSLFTVGHSCVYIATIIVTVN